MSPSTGGASQIAGGNYQVFERMLGDSGADVRLSTAVEAIEPTSSGFRVETNGKKLSNNDSFDEIFFAAPWHNSPVSKSLSSHFLQPIPYAPTIFVADIRKQDYVKLHVTLLATTRASPDPLYFFKAPGDAIPGTILTTDVTWRDTHGARPEFQSISYHGETYEGSGEWVVKIFSKAKISNALLADIFGDEPTWVYRKVWESYPVLRPTASFPPMYPMKGFHYLAALEPWVST